METARICQQILAEVRPYRIQDELARGRIVIVAGYPGNTDRHILPSEVAAADVALAQARQAVANTESALAVLLGRSPAAISAPKIARGADIDALL